MQSIFPKLFSMRGRMRRRNKTTVRHYFGKAIAYLNHASVDLFLGTVLISKRLA